jgi:predicted XRE-type DNA-binding protein
VSKAEDDFELVHGSGNVYRDFGISDADVRQTKAILAARIIHVLTEEGLSTRKAEARTGVPQADFSRIRNVRLDRFTIDRLMTVLNKLGQRVDVAVSISPYPTEHQQPGSGVVAGSEEKAPVAPPPNYGD